MVVEPPSHLWRVRVFEIDNGVFIAVKKAWSPGLLRAVRHASEAKFRGGIEFFPIEAVEQSGRGGPIKATVVEAEPDAGHVLELAPFSLFLP
jgi:hypothetical protein